MRAIGSPGAFTATPSLNVSRFGFAAAVLPNGKVLVEGGTTQDSQSTGTCELYDPAANVWTFTGSIQGQSANLVLLGDGDVLATDEITPPTSELYHPATGLWRGTSGQMHIPRIADSATMLVDGRVLVAGGNSSANVLVLQSEIYDPATQHWTVDALLNIARYVQSSVRLADGRVLVAGGLDADFHPISSAEIYSP